MTDKELYQQMLHFIECSGYRAESIKKELKIRLAQPEREWMGLSVDDQRQLGINQKDFERAKKVAAWVKEKNTKGE